MCGIKYSADQRNGTLLKMVIQISFRPIILLLIVSSLIESGSAYYLKKGFRKTIDNDNKRSFKPIRHGFDNADEPIRIDLDSLQPMRNDLKDFYQPINEDSMDFKKPIKSNHYPFQTTNKKRNFNEQTVIEPIENELLDFGPISEDLSQIKPIKNDFLDFKQISEDLNQIEPMDDLEYDNDWRKCGRRWCDGQYRMCDSVAKSPREQYECNIELWKCQDIRC
eukprot:TCONS_00059361-protein